MIRQLTAVPMLARRFLLSKASDGFLSFITWVSVVGVALGVLALTVVTSVINGFEGELTRVITGLNGDVILYSRGEPISDQAQMEAKIRRIAPSVQAMTPSFVSELMVSGPIGVAGAIIEGVDLETIGQVTQVPQRIISGRMPAGPDEVVLGYALADRIGAKEGTEIRVIAPFAGGDPGQPDSEMSAAPKVFQAKVVGLVRMGMYEYDSKYMFSTLPAIQGFLNQPGKVTSFRLDLPPGTDTRAVSNQLNESFGYPFRAKDWSQLNQNLFYAIQLEKVVIAIILTVIIVVAAFNVVSTLMMMIHDKTKEIAILKAMGFRPSQGFQLFCLIGMGIGLVGSTVGVLIGLGLSWLLEKTHWIDLPSEIYYIGFLPVVVRWREIAVIAGIALLITFVATLYPAWQVSRKQPLEGLRYD